MSWPEKGTQKGVSTVPQTRTVAKCIERKRGREDECGTALQQEPRAEEGACWAPGRVRRWREGFPRFLQESSHCSCPLFTPQALPLLGRPWPRPPKKGKQVLGLGFLIPKAWKSSCSSPCKLPGSCGSSSPSLPSAGCPCRPLLLQVASAPCAVKPRPKSEAAFSHL